MALKPETNPFAQIMRLAFFRSPNYQTGVSGWTINQDGSAEFNNITIRNGVIISGVFLLYSATPPAKGNLVLAFAPVAGGTDSVGNVYPQGFNWGVWDATGTLKQHFGIDTSGRLYIVGPDGAIRIQINNGTAGAGPDIRFFNDFGAVILVVDPNAGGTFQYQDKGSAVQGPLIGAQSGKNTTDPINATVVGAGITLIDPVFADILTAVGANISLSQALFTANAIVTANTGSGATSPFLSLAGPEQGHAGHAVLRVYGVSADGTVAQGVIISGTDPPVRHTGEVLEVQGNIAAALVKAVIGGTTEETWHTVGAAGQPAFAAGFAAGSSAPRFQLEPINGGRVRLAGQVNLTANQLSSATIFTLPAGYIPARTHTFSVPSTLSGGFNSGFIIEIDNATGVVKELPAGSNGNSVVLDGICFELD